MDYPKIIQALIEHFVDAEGTDYLGMQGDLAQIHGLSEEELIELTHLRDEVRRSIGWALYDD